jgi:hypothetical protein
LVQVRHGENGFPSGLSAAFFQSLWRLEFPRSPKFFSKTSRISSPFLPELRMPHRALRGKKAPLQGQGMLLHFIDKKMTQFSPKLRAPVYFKKTQTELVQTFYRTAQYFDLIFNVD